MAGGEGFVRAMFDAVHGKRKARKPGGSAAVQWLLANSEEFAASLAEHKRPDWSGLAAYLHEAAGIAGKGGGPIAGETLRMDWYRVRTLLREQGAGYVRFHPKPEMRKGEGRRRAPKPASPYANIPLLPNEIAHGVFLPPGAEAKPAAAPSDRSSGGDDPLAAIRRQLAQERERRR